MQPKVWDIGCMDIATSLSFPRPAESSPADRSSVGVSSPAQRSRVTNGKRLLEGIDGRSAEARRLRDLCQAYASPFGGLAALGPGDAALVRELAAQTVLSEQKASAIARGENVNLEDAVRIANTLQRLLARLDRRSKALTPKGPSLASYLGAKASAGPA
jgi:hypothetical protein